MSRTDCNNYCNRELKAEHEWLREVDKFALTNAIYNMVCAYQKFFKEGAGYPKFKSKHDNQKSYTTNFTNGNISVDFEAGKIKLPKLKPLPKTDGKTGLDLGIKDLCITSNGRKYVKKIRFMPATSYVQPVAIRIQTQMGSSRLIYNIE